MPTYPVILLHGYSDEGESFRAWGERLAAEGRTARMVHLATWRSRVNELTLADVAEAFERALAEEAGLAAGEPFDLIAHSTGALIVRGWLAADPSRRARLRHFIGLAPANFGSPLAHKGRSFLGVLTKGNKSFGADFLEVGDRILDALELGSTYGWALAHQDLLHADGGWYGDGDRAPWSYVICATAGYGWPKRLFADPPGSDGVIRWAGSALDARKFSVDLTRRAGGVVTVSGARSRDVPTAFAAGRNHGTLLSRPSGELAAMVLDALQVDSAEDDQAWRDRWCAAHRPRESWQQFIVRVRDERGDPVTDYNLQLEARYSSGARELIADFAADVHPYRRDPSLRAFHVRLADVKRSRIERLALKIIARSNTDLVGYRGVGSSRTDGWDGELDLTDFGPTGAVRLFHPFTTTLLEITLDREPRPYIGPNEVLRLD